MSVAEKQTYTCSFSFIFISSILFVFLSTAAESVLMRNLTQKSHWMLKLVSENHLFVLQLSTVILYIFPCCNTSIINSKHRNKNINRLRSLFPMYKVTTNIFFSLSKSCCLFYVQYLYLDGSHISTCNSYIVYLLPSLINVSILLLYHNFYISFT